MVTVIAVALPLGPVAPTFASCNEALRGNVRVRVQQRGVQACL